MFNTRRASYVQVRLSNFAVAAGMRSAGPAFEHQRRMVQALGIQLRRCELVFRGSKTQIRPPTFGDEFLEAAKHASVASKLVEV